MPILGNHDSYSFLYQNAAAGGYATAFGTALPQNGEGLSGGPGVPSGSWAYYSMNYGRVHIVALDSMNSRSNTSFLWGLPQAGGWQGFKSAGTAYPFAVLPASVQGLWAQLGSPRQAQWLAADLAAVAASQDVIDFVVVLYHHPAYADGSHKSDREVEMIEMRQLYNPILEAGGADIVFHGHSHQYERQQPTAGFVGTQAQWNPAFAFPLTTSTNALGTIQTQSKPAGITASQGTTYVVAGSGGQLQAAGVPNFVSKAFSLNATVSCVLDTAYSPNPTLTLTCTTPGVAGVLSAGIVDQLVISKPPLDSPPPPLFVMGLYDISGSFTVVGATLATLKLQSVIAAISSKANVPSTSVDIIVAAPSSGRRRALQQASGVYISYIVKLTSAAAASAAVKALAGIKAADLTNFGATGVSGLVVGPTSVVKPPPPPPPAKPPPPPPIEVSFQPRSLTWTALAVHPRVGVNLLV